MARGVGTAALVAALVVLAAVAPAGAGAQADAGEATIEQTVTLRLTPERPGSIAATASFDLPDSVTELVVSLPENATVADADGFERNGSQYEWDGETASPSVSFRTPANQSGVSYRGVNASGYTFADAGEWALVRVPDVAAQWWWEGADEVTLASNVSVAGEGVATNGIAYLGPHRTHSRTVGNRTIRLVVPEAATVEAGNESVLSALADADRALDLGGGESVVVAAPQSVEWAVDGAQLGSTGAWVAADEPLDSADDVWTHEYVHTRQRYRLAPEMAWFGEASAEYYAASLAVTSGRVPYAAFRSHVAPDDSGDEVLADPATWSARTAYRKGTVVLAALDARIRAATGGDRSLVDVSRRLNRHDGTVTLDVFLDAVESVADPGVRAFADRAVTGTATPDLPPATAFERRNESTGFGVATIAGGPAPARRRPAVA